MLTAAHMVCEDCNIWRLKADELHTRLELLDKDKTYEVVSLHRKYHAELAAKDVDVQRLAYARNELQCSLDELERRLRVETDAFAVEASALADARVEIKRLLEVQRSLVKSVSSLMLAKDVGGMKLAAMTRWTQTLASDDGLAPWAHGPGTAVQCVDAAVGADTRGLSATPRRSPSSGRLSGGAMDPSNPGMQRSLSPDVPRPVFRLQAPLPLMDGDRDGPAATLTFLKRKSNSAGGTLAPRRRSSTPFLSTSRGISIVPETPREVGRGGFSLRPSVRRSVSPGCSSRNCSVANTAPGAQGSVTMNAAAVSVASASPAREAFSAGSLPRRSSVSAAKTSLPAGALEKKFSAVRSAFAELRGLVLRADASMFVTLASVHTLRDCGCPLKLSIAKIKQTILLACPHLHKRIHDGKKWEVERRDLLGLREDAAGTIAASLREMVASHDYLRYHQRTEALQGALNEVYENVELWLELARSRRVQLIIN